MTTQQKYRLVDLAEKISSDLLPESMLILVGIIPMKAIIAIINTFGGARCYIPLRPRENDSLVNVVGMEAAQALANYAGGEVLEIPVATKLRSHIRHLQVMASLSKGVSQRDTALAFGMTERNVRLIRKKFQSITVTERSSKDKKHAIQGNQSTQNGWWNHYGWFTN